MCTEKYFRVQNGKQLLRQTWRAAATLLLTGFLFFLFFFYFYEWPQKLVANYAINVTRGGEAPDCAVACQEVPKISTKNGGDYTTYYEAGEKGYFPGAEVFILLQLVSLRA